MGEGVMGIRLCSLFIISIIGFSFVVGCVSRESMQSSAKSALPAPGHIIIAPTNFVKQISTANRVLVRPIGQNPLFKELKLSLTGKDAKDVVKAISILKKDFEVGVGYLSCNCENWKLEFYHNTNFLGVAHFVDDVVAINGEYTDGTGILKKLDKEISGKKDLLIPPK